LRLIRRVKPTLIIVDSEFMINPWPVVTVFTEDPLKDLNAIGPDGDRRVAVGIPSRSALELMVDVLGYKLEWLHWETVPEAERDPVRDNYRQGNKHRHTCALRPKKKL